MKSGKHWPWIVVGMLVANVAAMLVLVVLSQSGESHVVVDDYYRKAVEWDREMAQQRENLDLGWQVEVRPRSASDGIVLEVALRDRDGAPIEGADVALSTYHQARAGRVFRAELTDAGDGAYRTRLPLERAGLWRIEITAARGGERFTASLRRDIAPQLDPEAGGA